jgi:mono/diheme cytochrome c family protein
MIRISTAAAACVALLALTACASTTEDAAMTSPAPAAAAPAAAAPAAAIAAGQGIFQTRCAGCHREGASAPGRTALKGMGHAKIVEALTTGKMMAQGRALSDEDKSNVATFLTEGPAA